MPPIGKTATAESAKTTRKPWARTNFVNDCISNSFCRTARLARRTGSRANSQK